MKTLPLWLFLCLMLFVMASSFAQFIPAFDIQGHRGFRGLWPENTLSAMQEALDVGVTTLEMDVVVTQDHRVILSHEPWMAASVCLDSSGRSIPPEDEKKFNIYAMTYAQVKRFDCGVVPQARFPGRWPVSASKPLLRDVIVAVEDHIKNARGYEVDYNIEIKTVESGAGLFHPEISLYSDIVYTLIDQYLPLKRVVIQSFDLDVLRYWHETYPHVRLALLTESCLSAEACIQALGFVPSVYAPAYSLLTAAEVTFLHNRRIRVIPWTVNRAEDMEKLKRMGVDGLITDYPDRAVALFGKPVVPKFTE